jgi:predicted  nucleic acid-binding Zn-ribbon protein
MSSDERVTTLNLIEETSRCVTCGRLVTLRRTLLQGCCKCGSRRLRENTFLDEADLLEIEEDYGWNVRITNVGVNNVSKGLLPRGYSPETSPGPTTVEVDEARLHSRRVASFVRDRDGQHGRLARSRGFLGTAASLFSSDPGKWRDYLGSLKKPFFFFPRRRREG